MLHLLTFVLCGVFTCFGWQVTLYDPQEPQNQNAGFCAKWQNLPISVEFLRFCRILYWLVIRGQMRRIFMRFAEC